MKCPHCGEEIYEVEGYHIFKRAIGDYEGKLNASPIKWVFGGLEVREGTCIACLRGDCELAKKGISHT